MNNRSTRVAHALGCRCAAVDAHLGAPVGVDFIVARRVRCHSTALVTGRMDVIVPSGLNELFGKCSVRLSECCHSLLFCTRRTARRASYASQPVKSEVR